LKVLKKSLTTELKCVHLQLKENGQQNLKQNKINKKFVYLISPNKIKNNNFYKNLSKVLSSEKVSFFQLRLKKETNKNKLVIGKKIKKICKKYKVKFIINDDPMLAKKLNADGCHLGQKDMNIIKARKLLKNKIIGVTCHNSIDLAKKAIKDGANYFALGAFYYSQTKKVKYKMNLKILRLAKKITNTPIVAIGGIKLDNYKRLLLNKANFLAISDYIWNNKRYKPLEAINKLK
jgi:thiamine-phosphate pyrophosphorylase